MHDAVWFSILGAFLVLGHAMVGPLMVSQPLVLGFFFGAAMGDLPNGLLMGAVIQMIWIGVLPVGAHIPFEYPVTSGIAIPLALHSMRHAQVGLPVSLVVALGLAIPAGFLATRLDRLVRHLNNRVVEQAERLAEKGSLWGIGWAGWLGLLGTWIRNFLVFWVWLGPGAGLAAWLFRNLPAPAVKGLAAVFWILPALPFAVMLETVFKDRMLGWVLGSMGAAWVGVWIWPGQALPALWISAAVGVLLAARSREW